MKNQILVQLDKKLDLVQDYAKNFKVLCNKENTAINLSFRKEEVYNFSCGFSKTYIVDVNIYIPFSPVGLEIIDNITLKNLEDRVMNEIQDRINETL